MVSGKCWPSGERSLPIVLLVLTESRQFIYLFYRNQSINFYLFYRTQTVNLFGGEPQFQNPITRSSFTPSEDSSASLGKHTVKPVLKRLGL